VGSFDCVGPPLSSLDERLLSIAAIHRNAFLSLSYKFKPPTDGRYPQFRLKEK